MSTETNTDTQNITVETTAPQTAPQTAQQTAPETAPETAPQTAPKPDWDVEDSEYVYLGDGDSVTIKMLDEGVATVDKYNNAAVDFSVENMAFGVRCFWRVTSARVKRAMKNARPITGKVFEVERTGEKFETRYRIMEVTNIEQFIGA